MKINALKNARAFNKDNLQVPTISLRFRFVFAKMFSDNAKKQALRGRIYPHTVLQIVASEHLNSKIHTFSFTT